LLPHRHLLALRCFHLSIANWLIFQGVVDLQACPAFSRFISLDLMAAHFYLRIDEHSSHDHSELFADRIGAHNVRTGLSEDLSRTLIRQLLSVYDPDGFRCNADRRPWSVRFIGEPGIDAGGLAGVGL
jgi:hypothetical protein